MAEEQVDDEQYTDEREHYGVADFAQRSTDKEPAVNIDIKLSALRQVRVDSDYLLTDTRGDIERVGV